jgi:tRNA(Ile)-lysidine synthase
MNINVAIKNALNTHFKGQVVTFVLGVSGGPDSQCLLKAFPHVLRDVNPESSCIAVGVNHGLRPEANDELDLARCLALGSGTPFSQINIRIAPGSNIQARARDGRYDALRSFADSRKNAVIVTAHHFDDRAETVLIRLLRGKKFGSLGVMPALNGRIFRPLLQVRRSEIEGYLKRWKIESATDPSNSNTKYLRTKVRKELLPAMEVLSPKIRERLNELADEALGMT